MKNLNYVIGLLLISTLMQAQQIKISGTVRAFGDQQPLPGVNVVIKGSTTTVITDFDGKYSLKAHIHDTLVYSYVGFDTAERKIKEGDSIINLALVESSAELEEVIVVGYGNRNVKSIVSSISALRSGSKASRKERKQVRKNGIPIVNPNNIQIRGISCAPINNTNYFHPNHDNESYKEIKENSFKNVKNSPLSTFSIDVDKASYSNVRRMINNGETIPVDAVKIEEMINYFDYDYKQPEDEHPFAIHTEYGITPWNATTQIVKIGLKGKEIPQNEIPPSNLVFLIDVSGSMNNPNKLPLLKQAFKLLVNQLREKDKVSIVVYAGAAGMVLSPTSGANKNKINQALQNLSAGGSTAGGAGIKLAYKIAQKNFIKNGNNRVILATDGDFNVGMSSDKNMQKLIEEKRESGVFLTCLGFGMGNYKDSKLETLANKGNGNHAYIDSMQEARLVLGKEFGGTLYTIAKDVKIQVEFNPEKIQAYRLIGYENRWLADEDFVDDTKDAGELGSGHTVTALYEVIPTGVQNEYVKNVPELKYTQRTSDTTYGDELLTVKFRYKKPKEKKSIEIIRVVDQKPLSTSQDFNFATAVAWFGMKIRDSKYLKDKELQHIISLAASGKANDPQGYKAEFVRLLHSYQSL